MQGSTLHNFIDYFKLFKVFDLKKLEKTGLVKLVQDKLLNRKILSVEGNISTANYINFSTANHPNISFSERYLYIQGFLDPGKSFCMQVAYSIGNKQYKAVYSTLYKSPKKHLENIVHLPIGVLPDKWNIAVIDLYELGLPFGLKPEQMKMIFRVTGVEIRASSKVKGIFQADYLYSVDKMPKDLVLPLKKQEQFFEKYHYFVVSSDEALLKEVCSPKQVQKQILQSKKEISKVLETSKSKEGTRNMNRCSSSKADKKDKKQDVTGQQRRQKHNSKQKLNKGKSPPQQNLKGSNRPPMPQQHKQKTSKDHPQQIQQDLEEVQPQEHELLPPKPQGTISLELSCIEGFSVNRGTLSTVESYLSKPVYMPTHKPIQLICSCDSHNVRVLTAYSDGSICLWDTIRKQPLNYFMTELQQIKEMLIDDDMNLVIFGMDKMKREVINIVSNNSVIFRQISNYNIYGAMLVSKHTFQQGLITFGYQNIRLWRVNNQKAIIQGSNIYLGQTNRKVKYTSAIIIKTPQDYLAFITDTNGFVTTLSLTEAKMLQSLKIDQHPIDHIIQLKQYADPRALITNQLGILKILNLQTMELLEELNINSRIKSIEQLPNSVEIVLTHYNKSIGSINLESGLYSFLMRSHTAPVTKIIYNSHYNKVVSMSKDTSIRIWQYVVDSQGSLPFRLQEQYQFLIAGEQMTDAVCACQGKPEQLKFVVVGGDSGKLIKIDIQSYCIRQQIIIEAAKMSLSISRNGKYILSTYESGNSYLLDASLNIICKYLLGRGQKRKVKNWRNGFNLLSKEYFIQNFQEERFEFYSLKSQKDPLFFISNKQVNQIEAISDKVFIVGQAQLRIHHRSSLLQVLNLNSNYYGIGIDSKNYAFEYPILCCVLGDKVHISVLLTNFNQYVQLPENVHNLTIYHSHQKQEGYIFCSGVSSFALYVISYQLHNISYDLQSLSHVSQASLEARRHQEGKNIQAEQEMEISFSQTTLSAFTNQPPKQTQRPERAEEQPRELKKLYGQQQQLYQQVKQYLFPKAFYKQPEEQQQNEENKDTYLDFNQQEKDGISILLQYGYQQRQDAIGEKEVGSFYWIAQNNSMLLLTGSNKDILQHFFTVPIQHKLASFPSSISSVALSTKTYQSMRYLAVCVNSLIKIYNAFEEISYIRTIQSLSNAMPTSVIYQCKITNCNRYLLTLSYNGTQIDAKIYIHVLEISTGSVVTSSYLSLPPPKNKYKNTQLKEIRQYRLKVNPYKNALQFIVYNPEGVLHFYRITSILSLQTMQLEELVPLVRDKISQITTACFISVGQETFEDAVIALGSQNGSVVFVDTRTANILIACVGLLPNSHITRICFAKSTEQEASKLILFTDSTNIIIYNLYQGLNSLLASMEQVSSQSRQQKDADIKQMLTLDGEVTACSSVQNQGQQLVITKCGTLWLLDYDDLVTVKISSIHTAAINKAQVLSSSNGQACLITCSDDGCMKISNLMNLQQTLQIYKPRKQSKTFNLNGSYTLVAFGSEIFLYNKINAESSINELTSLGSFKLDHTVVDIQNIPTTDNYYILTENEFIVAYISSREVKSKSQMTVRSVSNLSHYSTQSLKQIQVQAQLQKVTDVQHPFKIVVNQDFAPYDQFALLAKPGKSTVWTRKCLKRNVNPLQQLANVHELSYYLIDATSRNTTQNTYLKFIGQHQYLWGLLEEGLIQIRNYREHAVMRQINISLNNLTCMLCLENELFTFIAGDQQGNIYVLNQNGLLMERVKALQCSVTGISVWQNQNKKRLVVNGSKFVSIIANPGLK